MNKNLNLHYGLLQGAYYPSFSVFLSYASVFLLPKGYSNSMIGIIFALANVMALLVQPLLANLADKGEKWNLPKLIGTISIFIVLMTITTAVSKEKGIIMSLSYILIVGSINLIQPLINSLNFNLKNRGFKVSFGLTRSIGSLTYAITSTTLGSLIVLWGSDVLSISGILIFTMVTAFSFLLYIKGNFENPNIQSLNNGDYIKEQEITIKDFLMNHKSFLILNIGIMGVFFGNQIYNNFMFQIVSNVGGTSKDMGHIFTVLALAEIPAFLLFDKVNRKFSCKTLLRVAGISYVLQIAFYMLAQNIMMIFVAQIFQCFSFGMMLPSMVHLIDENMREKEAVKGQSMFVMAMIFTTIFCSVLGGIVIDVFGVSTLLMLAMAMAVLGSVIIFRSVNKIK